jgi:hypothetical protein
MSAVFPPVSEEQAAAAAAEAEAQRQRDAATIEQIASRCEGKAADLAGDVHWVYAHIGDAEVGAGEFPSLRAWRLWRWAKQARSAFFETLLPNASAVRQKQRDIESLEEQEERAT